MTKKETLIQTLTAEQKKALLQHFNTIYECEELSETENKIIYLAWLWKEGYVKSVSDGPRIFDEIEAGVPLTYYEITFEDENSGGINLDLTYDFYEIDKIIEIIEYEKIQMKKRIKIIKIDPDDYPVYCPFCKQQIAGCETLEGDDDEEEIEDEIENYEYTPCEHTLFIAGDEGFEYRSERFSSLMSLPPFEVGEIIEYDDNKYKGFDELTDDVSIPGAIKYAGYVNNWQGLNVFYGFEPIGN